MHFFSAPHIVLSFDLHRWYTSFLFLSLLWFLGLCFVIPCVASQAKRTGKICFLCSGGCAYDRWKRWTAGVVVRYRHPVLLSMYQKLERLSPIELLHGLKNNWERERALVSRNSWGGCVGTNCFQIVILPLLICRIARVVMLIFLCPFIHIWREINLRRMVFAFGKERCSVCIFLVWTWPGTFYVTKQNMFR
jgi:hypothetical protein